MIPPTTHQVITHQKAGAIVDNVTHALADVDHAFTLLINAKKRLADTMGDGLTYYHNLFPQHNINEYDLGRTAKESRQYILSNAWRYIITQTGMTAYMTEKRQKELMAQLEKGDIPELTVANILGTLTALAERTPDLLREAVKEVFDWLRPRHNWGVGMLKTNQKWRVGYKVIIGSAVEQAWTGKGWRLNCYREPHLRTLGNVFSLLDGTGVERYPDDLITRLKQGFQESWEAVDRYGIYKAYKNGNLHITFTRHDLVDRLNAMAGDATLAPEQV